jgi:NAD(P)-dependent dehydrogenase (short-subunit alcohol dehydrogenase family)
MRAKVDKLLMAARNTPPAVALRHQTGADMTDAAPADRPTSFPNEPHQPRPGLTTKMRTKPDHGEESYVGKGLLTDKVALITGGDSGIGRAVAIAYAREGADVAISYLEAEQVDAKETQAWVEKAGRRCLLLPGDIRDRDHCAQLVERTVGELGALDILVNNAAAQTMNEGIETIDDDEMQGAFAANVFAMIRLAKAARPHMKRGSAIVNTTSEQAKVATESMIVYAATKGAISSLTVGLSNLLAADGIRVNAVAPGPIWTPIQPIAKSPEELETLGHDTPLGRAGQPAELAPAYVLLASAEGSYMSGNVVAVTGGVPIS